MAFGFGFNKQKVLSAAEKCVQQGKLQNAISEYEKILKHDPKDLTVMNTVGDLHARLGENDKAAQWFKNVGDAYASQGFTVKAIAMYKKLSKLKASTECVLRLAELYTQQGLFNDARAQYLQVAEEFLKSGQLDQAVRIFEKTLEMDPENVAMRTRLAEVYVRIGKKKEAWQILTAAAESLRTKGQLAAADEVLQRMLKLDPGNSYALVLRGRAALEGGDARAAIDSLSKVADLDTNPEGLRALFQAYLHTKKFSEAGALAGKLATVHNDGAAIQEYTDALMEAQRYRDVLGVYEQYSDQLLRADPAKFIEALRPMIGPVQDDPQALELLLSLFQKAGENAHLTEVYELLAHAYVQSGDLEKAREMYLKLMQLEPANQMHARNYQQVVEKLGSSSTQNLITAEEGAVLVDELEATAPFIDQRYDDEVALAVRSALTDAELFISYNMPAKALAPLLSALPKAPRDLRLNQKLGALHTRAGRFAEAAVCFRTLEGIYRDAGHSEESARYADLALKYEERAAAGAGVTPEHAPAKTATPAAPEFEIAPLVVESSSDVAESTPDPEQAATAATTVTPSGLFFHGAAPTIAAEAAAPAPAEEFAVASAAVPEPGEVDLSTDWEQDLTMDAPPAAPVEPVEDAGEVAAAEPEAAPVEAAPEKTDLDESIEEVRFYLEQGLIQQAGQLLNQLEAKAPGSAELGVLRQGIESAKRSHEAEVPELEASPAETVTIEDEPAVEAAPAPKVPATPQPWPKERPVLQEMVSEIEESLGDDFLGGAEATPARETQPAVEAASSKSPAFSSGSLDEFVSDLEASLGDDFAEPAPEPPARVEASRVRAAAASAGAGRMPAPMNHAPAMPGTVSRAKAPLTPGPDQPAAGVDLASMFGDLKQELEGEAAGADEDPETHYNLGVAFREMGLLDEAIGEFQKVCQSAERGHAFAQIMQAYTWLAQCFLDKGVPEAAVRWYEKALNLPNLDQETRTALHYELASSLESAGNKTAALNNFLEVYGSNI
ncbi:MAG TPA: tetratricopeptide repeat protein, partial [Terriglobales bacterium]|nr:tetratricopeptide repeat protein [Terriglobales bacterium]